MNVYRRVALASSVALAIAVAPTMGGSAQASQMRASLSAPQGAKDAADQELRRDLNASTARYRVAVREAVVRFNEDPDVKAARVAYEAAVDTATSAWWISAQDGPATEIAKSAILRAKTTYGETTLPEASTRATSIDAAAAIWLQEALTAYAAHDNASLAPTEAAARIAYRASSNQAWSAYSQVQRFCVEFEQIKTFINWPEVCPLLPAATTQRDQALAAAWQVYVTSGGSATREIPGASLKPPAVRALSHSAGAPHRASVASHVSRASDGGARKALRAALKAAKARYSVSYVDAFTAFWGATSGPDAVFDAAIESATDAWSNSDHGGAALEATKVANYKAEAAYSTATLPEASARETVIDAAKALWLQDALDAYATFDWATQTPTVAAARVTYRASSNGAWEAYDSVKTFCRTAYIDENHQRLWRCGLLFNAVKDRDQVLAAARQAYHNTVGEWPTTIPGDRLRYPTVVTSY